MNTPSVHFHTDLSALSDTALQEAIHTGLLKSFGHVYVTHTLHSMYRFHGEIMEPGMIMGLNPQVLEEAQNALRDRYEPMLSSVAGVSFHVLHGVEAVEVLRFIRRHRPSFVFVPMEVAKRSYPHVPITLEEILRRSSPAPVLFFDPGRKVSPRKGFIDSYAPHKGPSKVVSLQGYRRQHL